MYKIKILNKIAPEGLALFNEGYSLSEGETTPDGILVRSSELNTGDYPSLLAVARAGAGVNNISVDQATEQGVCVFNTPGANANAVAELVFIMLGINARNIHRGMDFCQSLSGKSEKDISDEVEKRKSLYRGFELAGKTLGVLGLGQIGVRVANLGIKHRMKVVGFDPFPAMENIHQLSPAVGLARSLDEVLRADIFSVHVPLNDKTRGVVNTDLLAKLPENSVLVNFARGPIVDEPAVLDALEHGTLASYITDFPTPATVDHPQVICSPHLGASTEESEEQCAVMAARELKGYLEYGTIFHSVNFPTAESIPSGNVCTRLIMINRDVPGMIGFASQTIGEKGINIASYLNESNGKVGYNIIDLESPLPDEVRGEIENHHGVIRTRTIEFN